MRPLLWEKANNHSMFQSTHPERGATPSCTAYSIASTVSIHAPRAGCDTVVVRLLILQECFNPRTPSGVRLIFRSLSLACKTVSIHAPRAGCDTRGSHFRGGFVSFNPRTPSGVRQLFAETLVFRNGFNPRTPSGVRPMVVALEQQKKVSIHAPRAGCDRRLGGGCMAG